MNTTLKQLKQWNACTSGYRKIAEHIKDENKEFNVLTILETNDVSDTVWVLSHDTDTYRFQSLMVDIISLMVNDDSDQRVIDCLQALKDFREGKIDKRQLRIAAAYAAAADAQVTKLIKRYYK